MSTFTNWNGPGDCAGDLTIFYQQLQELTRKITSAQQDYNGLLAIVNTYDGRVTNLESATGNTISTQTAFENLIGQFLALRNAFNNYTQGTGSGLNTGALTAVSATINGLLQAKGDFIVQDANGNTVFNIDHASKIIQSMYDWIHLAQWFYFNTAAEYQDIRLKIGGVDDPTDTSANNAINRQMKPNLITTTGDIPVAILDLAETQVGYTHGSGTVYVSIRNTIHADAVINIVAHHDSADDEAATMTVVYDYYKQNVNNQVMHFALRHATDRNSRNVLLLYIYGNPAFGSSTFTNVWVHGRGLRRWTTDDPTSSTDLIDLYTAPGDRGAGFLADKTILNSLRVRGLLDVFGNLNVNGAINTDELVVSGDTTIKGDLDVTQGEVHIKDIVIEGSVTYPPYVPDGPSPDQNIAGDVVINGSLEVLNEPNPDQEDPAFEVLGNSKLHGDVDLGPHILNAGDAFVNNLFLRDKNGVVRTNSVVAVTDYSDTPRFLLRFVKGTATGYNIISIRTEVALQGLFGAYTSQDEMDLLSACEQYKDNFNNFIATGNAQAYNLNRITILTQLWDPIAKKINAEADAIGISSTIERIATSDDGGNLKTSFSAGNTVYGDAILSNVHRTFTYEEVFRIDTSGGTTDKVILGHYDENGKKALAVLESSGRPVARVQGTDNELAYLQDVITGLFYRGNVDLCIDGDPMTWQNGQPITAIPLVDGTFKQINDGMLCLRKGRLDTGVVDPITGLPDPTHPVYFLGEETRIYQAKNVQKDPVTGNTISAIWELYTGIPSEAPGGIYTPPPYMPTDTYGIYQWTGYIQYESNLFSYEYIVWDVNRGTSPLEIQWQVINIALEGYRLAVDQDRIDQQIALLAYALQPNWLDENPTLEISIPGIPSRIPNPAYIMNKPVMGVSHLSAGDWDALHPFKYDHLVMGGDYLQFYEHIRASIADPLTDQPIKDVILQLMHGNAGPAYNQLPVATQNTAFTLKWCIDKKELYLDTGNPGYIDPTGNLTVRKGNILIFPFGSGGGSGAFKGPVDVVGPVEEELTGDDIDNSQIPPPGTLYIFRKGPNPPNEPCVIYLVRNLDTPSTNLYEVQVLQGSAISGGIHLKRYSTNQNVVSGIDGYAYGDVLVATTSAVGVQVSPDTYNDSNLSKDLVDIKTTERDFSVPGPNPPFQDTDYKLNILLDEKNNVAEKDVRPQPAFLPWRGFQFIYDESFTPPDPSTSYGWVDFAVGDLIYVKKDGLEAIYRVRQPALAGVYTFKITSVEDIWGPGGYDSGNGIIIIEGNSANIPGNADDGNGTTPPDADWIYEDVTAEFLLFENPPLYVSKDQIVEDVVVGNSTAFYKCTYSGTYNTLDAKVTNSTLLTLEPKVSPILPEGYERSSGREGVFIPTARTQRATDPRRTNAEHSWKTFMDMWSEMALYPPSACTDDTARFPTNIYGTQAVGSNRKAPQADFPRPSLPDHFDPKDAFFPGFKKWKGSAIGDAPMYFPYWFRTFESQAEWIEP